MRAYLTACLLVLLIACGDGKRRPDVPLVFLTYEVVPAPGQDLQQARDQALTGIRQRIDERGLEHLGIWKDSTTPSRLQVELGGKDVPFDLIIELIERRATLGIHLVDEGAVAHALFQSAMDEDPRDVFPLIDHVWSEDRAALEAWLVSRPASIQPPGDRRVVLERLAERGLNGGNKWRTYVIVKEPIIGGGDVARASLTYDVNTQRPEVEVELDDDGRQRFAEATAAAIGRKLAIVLDGRVMSAPLVNGEIPGGRVRITMGGDDPKQQEREAYELIAVIQAGNMPELRLVERRDVGPAR